MAAKNGDEGRSAFQVDVIVRLPGAEPRVPLKFLRAYNLGFHFHFQFHFSSNSNSNSNSLFNSYGVEIAGFAAAVETPSGSGEDAIELFLRNVGNETNTVLPFVHIHSFYSTNTINNNSTAYIL